MSDNTNLSQILLFDGVCNLCNAAVQYVIRHDKKKTIKFASLQSPFGRKVLTEKYRDTSTLKTFIYIKNEEVLTKSSAFLTLMKDLGGIQQTAIVFWIIPRFLRDALYDFIATKRYAVFGKKESCYLPSPELEDRFIQD